MSLVRTIVSVGLHVPSAGSLCPKCQGTLARRDDDSPAVLEARLVQYNAKTKPLLAYYEERGLLHVVNSSRTPDLVFQSVSAI
jgi:adenylate kinase